MPLDYPDQTRVKKLILKILLIFFSISKVMHFIIGNISDRMNNQIIFKIFYFYDVYTVIWHLSLPTFLHIKGVLEKSHMVEALLLHGGRLSHTPKSHPQHSRNETFIYFK